MVCEPMGMGVAVYMRVLKRTLPVDSETAFITPECWLCVVCVYLSACISVYSMHTGYLELSVSKPMRFHLAV